MIMSIRSRFLFSSVLVLLLTAAGCLSGSSSSGGFDDPDPDPRDDGDVQAGEIGKLAGIDHYVIAELDGSSPGFTVQLRDAEGGDLGSLLMDAIGTQQVRVLLKRDESDGAELRSHMVVDAETIASRAILLAGDRQIRIDTVTAQPTSDDDVDDARLIHQRVVRVTVPVGQALPPRGRFDLHGNTVVASLVMIEEGEQLATAEDAQLWLEALNAGWVFQNDDVTLLLALLLDGELGAAVNGRLAALAEGDEGQALHEECMAGNIALTTVQLACFSKCGVNVVALSSLANLGGLFLSGGTPACVCAGLLFGTGIARVVTCVGINATVESPETCRQKCDAAGVYWGDPIPTVEGHSCPCDCADGLCASFARDRAGDDEVCGGTCEGGGCQYSLCGDALCERAYADFCGTGSGCSDDGECVCERAACGDGVITTSCQRWPNLAEECDPRAAPTGCAEGLTCNPGSCKCEEGEDEPCGNGTIDDGESCDPMADPVGCDDGEECASDCGACEPDDEDLCGNGMVDEGEDCDRLLGGGCPDGERCTMECACEDVPDTCGNSEVDEGEACDFEREDAGCPGNLYCTTDCTCISLADCGNNVLDPGEQCDDGPENTDTECEPPDEESGCTYCTNACRRRDVRADLVVCEGDFALMGREDIEAIADCTRITGGLSVPIGSELTDVDGLERLTQIGSLLISGQQLRDLHGLRNLERVHRDNTHGGVTVQSTRELLDLSGLENLRYTGAPDSPGILTIDTNSGLTSLIGLDGAEAWWQVNIRRNPNLATLAGFSPREVGLLNVADNESLQIAVVDAGTASSVFFTDNPQLGLVGMGVLQEAGGITFSRCPELTTVEMGQLRTTSGGISFYDTGISSLGGFASVSQLGGLGISDNPNLSTLGSAFPSLSLIDGNLGIGNNRSLPQEDAEAFGNRVSVTGIKSIGGNGE
jgi:hypothetical protein